MPAPRSAAAPSCGDRRLITRQAEWLLGAAELAADQPRIEPVAGQQFAMGAGLDEPATVEHGEPVDVAHGRQPMGDDDGRAVAHQRVEGGAHLRLADRVEVRGRLVEDQGWRVFQESAGYRDALALP